MEISKLIELLKAGEVKKLFLKNSDTDLLGFINSGIVDLYKRFPLWRDSVSVTPVIGTNDYKFDGDDGNVSIELDESQLMLIEEVVATDENDQEFSFIPSNRTRPKDFSTPTYNMLRIHDDYLTSTIDVEVRLAPNFLTRTNDAIPLPPQLIELLMLFTAYKAHSSVNADVKEENNSYYMRYEKAVMDVIASGQFPLDPLDSQNFTLRGFV